MKVFIFTNASACFCVPGNGHLLAECERLRCFKFPKVKHTWIETLVMIPADVADQEN
jgi:hypothetical protein